MKQKESKKRGLFYYVKIWFIVLKLSLSKTHAYKAEVIANILRVFIVVIPQLIAIYALYGENTEYVGWKIEESFLVLGIFNLINYIGWSFFSINLGRMDEKIEKGEWDFLLLKPISTIFSASFIDFFIYNLVLALSGVVFILYYLIKSTLIFDIEVLLKALITISTGVVIWFSMSLISASFAFLKTHTGFQELIKSIFNISRFPVNTWPSVVQIVFYTVIPIGLVSTIPAKVITGSMSWEAVGISVLVSVVFLLLAKLIWNRNASKYSSTGS